jgi:hypothetical protein
MILGCAEGVHVAGRRDGNSRREKMEEDNAETQRAQSFRADLHPTPVFPQKRPQSLENKGKECGKEGQERREDRKHLKTRCSRRVNPWSTKSEIPVRKKLGGNADDYENKRVVKIATQKMLKTKKLKIDCFRGARRVRINEERRLEIARGDAEP